MISDLEEDKSPVRSVFWTIFHSTALFLMLLQIGELVTKFRREHVTFSVTISHDDVPFPAVSICTTDVEDCFNSVQSVMEDIVPDFEPLYVDAEPFNVSDIEGSSRKFTPQAMKTLEDIDKFPCEQPAWIPLDNLDDCTFQNYSCIDKTGSFHNWKKSTEWARHCQTLRISKKIQPKRRTTLTLTWKTGVDKPLIYYLHSPNDTLPLLFSSSNQAVLYSEPGSINRHWMDVSKSIDLPRRLEESQCLLEEEAKSYDKTKCIESCIINHLLKQNGSCVLPWMKIEEEEGHSECSDLKEFVQMMQISMNSSKKLAMHCNCPPRCTRYSYTSIESVRKDKPNSYQQQIRFDIKEGIMVTEERWDYGLWQLIADSAGSIDIFYGFDILGFLYSIGTIVAWISVKRRWVTEKYRSSVKNTVITSAWALCLGMLLIQLTELYLMYARKEIKTNMKVNSEDILSAPRVSLCAPRNDGVDAAVLLTNRTAGFYKARESLINCMLNSKGCLKNKGPDHRWKRDFYEHMMCDTIIPSSDAASLNWNVSFAFSYELDFNISVYVHKFDHVPYFNVIPVPVNTYQLKDNSTYYTYSLREDSLIEKTCNPEYLKCLEDCVMLKIDSESSCSLPWLKNKSIKKECDTKSQYRVTKDISDMVIDEGWVNQCACRRPCRSVEYELVGTINREEQDAVLVILLSKELSVQMLQEMAYSATEFLSECGASIDFFIGLSVVEGFNKLFIFMLICINWLATKNYTDVEKSKWVKFTKQCIKIFGWSLFTYMIYTRVLKFMKSPMETVVSEAPHLSEFIPAVTLCSESEDTIETLRTSVKDCMLQEEPCATPNGTYHRWSPLYDMDRACISLIVQNETDLPVHDINIELYLNDTPTIYIHDRRQTFSSLGSDASEQTRINTELMYMFKLRIRGEKFQRLKGISDDCAKPGEKGDYNECLKKCLLHDVDNFDECLVPSHKEDKRMNPSECVGVNKKQREFMIERREAKEECDCPLPCSKIQYEILEQEKILMKGKTDSCHINIQSIPEDNVSIEEKKSYPMSEMWSDIGGLMGVFAGASLFTIYGFLETIVSNCLFCRFFHVKRAPREADTPIIRFRSIV